jgi:hypothetical protein
MQNRSFDIAGPNPTREEQKHIDEQYTAFLDRERQSRVAALAAKQQLMQQASLRNEQAPLRYEKVPVPMVAPNKAQASPSNVKPQPASGDIKSRAKAANCPRHSFSCDWPRLSDGIKGLTKALFGSSSGSGKAKRG